MAFDVLYRLLSQALKYDVQYVRNFTDVDDKIIARATERGEDPLELAGRFIKEFHLVKGGGGVIVVASGDGRKCDEWRCEEMVRDGKWRRGVKR